MNDFFKAANQVYVNQFEIKITQVTVRELNDWFIHAEPIRESLKQDYSDDNLEHVISKNKLQVLFLCAYVTDLEFDQLSELLNHNADKFISIFKDVVIVNSAYFDQIIQKQDSKSKSTWFDSFQFLINKGHRHSDILDYSYGAFLEYLKAAQRNEKNNLLSLGSAMRVSYHADKQGFSKFSDEMQRD